MSFIQAFAASAPLAGFRRLRQTGMASFASAAMARIATKLGWCESHLIGVAGALIVLFIAAPGLIRALFRLRDSRGGGARQLAKGWNG